MELLQELEVWYIIPAIRKELASAMKNNGLKQVEIAERLGLTKAAITQYLNDKRGNEIKFKDNVKQEIAKSASKINTKLDTIREIQRLLDIARQEKLVCQVHRDKESGFNECNVCFEQPLVQIGAGK